MFSKNLRYYRLKRDLSKKDLAAMIQVTPMSISHYENGERMPSADIIRALAKALGVRALDLFANGDEKLEFVHGEFRKPRISRLCSRNSSMLP